MAQQTTKTEVKQIKAKIRIAFQALRNTGILARMNFSCCSTCAHFEMDHDATAMAAEGKPVTGYAFYHEQAETRLKEKGDVHIGYNYCGPADQEPESTRRAEVIGSQVLAALTVAGLNCEWSGDAGTRILVRG